MLRRVSTSFFAALAILIFCFADSAYADSIDYNVSINQSLNFTILSGQNITLNLNPDNHDFDYGDTSISVGTNNPTGYKVTLSTTGNSTDLVRNNSTDGVNATIGTLPTLSGGYTDATFVANKWGYKITANSVNSSAIMANYMPFTSGDIVLQNNTYANSDTATVRFASKINNSQPAGNYSLNFTFNAVANPIYDYIQDFTKAKCQELASSGNYTVYDKRDEKDYTVRYINGNCWMTQNLRFAGTSLSPATSNVNSDTNITWSDLSSGNIYTAARYHNPGNSSLGYWYNYAGASAMSIATANNSTVQATQSICPAGWRLPTTSEQSGIRTLISEYGPVSGGYYNNGALGYDEYGFWWGSTAVDGTQRDVLRYYNGDTSMAITAGIRYRYLGFYVRCIRST